MTPAKQVAKVWRELGGHPGDRTRDARIWAFPDGAQKMLPNGCSPSYASRLKHWAWDRYGPTGQSPITANPVKGRKPVIDLERCVASDHARERMTLMRNQLGVEYAEVLLALTTPSRVLYSDTHGSWVWVGDRVAVCARVADDGWATISTVLWTTHELWDLAPRPERANAS